MERAVVRVIRIFEYGIQQAVGRKPLPRIRRAELEVFYRCGLLLLSCSRRDRLADLRMLRIFNSYFSRSLSLIPLMEPETVSMTALSFSVRKEGPFFSPVIRFRM